MGSSSPHYIQMAVRNTRAYNMLVVVACVWFLTAVALRETLIAKIPLHKNPPPHIWSLMGTFMALYGMRLVDHALGNAAFRQDVTIFVVSLFAGFLLDRIVLIPCCLKGRYPIIHCLGNIVVAAVAWNGAAGAFMRPSDALRAASDLSPYVIALAIHAYHVIAFRPLPAADWKHHLLMVVLPLPLVVWVPSGQLTGLVLFATCGAPGAISYGAIALRKNDVLSRLEEKRINAAVNTWFRVPLVTISGYAVFVATWSHPAPTLDRVVGTCISLLIFWNGQFYGRQVVENYGSCIMECRVDRTVPHPTVC